MLPVYIQALGKDIVALTTTKRLRVRNSLELKLKRCSGTRLQEFLASMMSKVHGDGFAGTSTAYSRGDLQCDGCLLDPLTIFACYGPANQGASASEGAIKKAVDKIEDDLAGALKAWPDLKAWKFVHNFFDTPAQIVHKIHEVRQRHPEREIALFGKEQFEALLLEMTEEDIEDLVGDAAMAEDFRALQPQVVLQIVEELMSAVDLQAIPDNVPITVPSNKLHFNDLSIYCQSLIKNGLVNAKRTALLLQYHPDPMLDINLAAVFKAKYLELKAHGLSPDDILFALVDFTGGSSRLTAERDAAVWTLLAHLFEKCTIFEDAPVAVIQ